MPSLTASILITTLSTISSVSAHGYVSQIAVNGQQYQGYNPSFGTQGPSLAAWSTPQNTDLGPIVPPKYTDPDIICHRGATPGQEHIAVNAGDTLKLTWNTWPETHHGPVIDYLAPCDGECTGAEKTALKFTKIAEKGLIDGSTPPGNWASDQLLSSGVSWDVKIPQCVKPGNYVLRHEIIALHEAFDTNKAQNYPQCINLKITGGGSSAMGEGVPATQFYKPGDPGITVGIYNPLTGYEIPGPGLWSCGGGGGGSGSGSGSGSTMESGSNSVTDTGSGSGSGTSGEMDGGSGMGQGTNGGSGSNSGSGMESGMDDGMGGENGTETNMCRREIRRSRKFRA
ncbi:MAG: hypothetical protein Q9176_003558 [Flavoplaca citrina]